MQNEKIYCPSMWKSIHVDVDGYLTPCCIFIHKEDKTHKLTDIENVNDYIKNNHQKYRDSMDKGIWPDGCNQCKFAEEEGRKSKRLGDMHNIKSFKTPNLDPNLEYLQLKTGRICNLNCTICHPVCSTTVAKHQLKIGKINKSYFDELNENIEWTTELNEFNKLTPKNGFYRIDISGGEPLLNNTHFEWLNSLENKDCTLLYNTNGTIRPTKYQIDVWKKFKNISLAVSIDSYGENFEKLRVNAKWDKVLENFIFLEQLITKEFKNSHLLVTYTLHEGNINDIFEFNRIMQLKTGNRIRQLISINYLYYPEHLAIHNLSKEKIKESIEIYENNLHTIKNKYLFKQLVDVLDSLKSFYNTSKKVESNRHIEKTDNKG